MTLSLLPLVVSVDSDHRPVYHLRTVADDATFECFTPHLPGDGFLWATPEQVHTSDPRFELTVGIVAELLAHAPLADPDTLTAVQAADIIDHELNAVGCDMAAIVADVAADQADHYDGGQRYSRLVLAAGRLLGVSL